MLGPLAAARKLAGESDSELNCGLVVSDGGGGGGWLVLTVNVRVAALWSVLFAASLARTEKV